MRRTPRLSLLLAATMLAVSGCQLTASPTPTPAGAENATLTPGTARAPSDAAAPMAPPPSVAKDAAGAAGAGIPADTAVAPDQQQAEALRAGAVDDNAKFQDYLSYVKAYAGTPMRALDVSTRYWLKVVDAGGHAVANADVSIKAGETEVFKGKTYANGQLLFHPRTLQGQAQTQSFAVSAAKGQNVATATLGASQQQGIVEIKLPAAEAAPAPKLDVLFLLDATGSMGGEIGRLQATLATISDRIKQLPGTPAVRFGLVSYRDQGDDYVTRETAFTADVASFQAALNQVTAAGGGDYPEDMEAGLAAGLNKLEWDASDAVRLAFLVADAPPQLGYAQGVPYTATMAKAVEKGVKFYPVGASGLSREGEFVMRQLAQFTLGQYLFITRGGDELSGGGEVSHTVDKYAEGRLDDIVVDIVKAELDSLGK